jgi:hypothetical protein
VDVLEGPNGLVEDQNGLMDIALAFYKDLFNKEDRLHISVSQDLWGQEHLVLDDNENDLLIAPLISLSLKLRRLFGVAMHMELLGLMNSLLCSIISSRILLKRIASDV